MNKKKKMEQAGIDPAASCMLSKRSTIWATIPFNILWKYKIIKFKIKLFNILINIKLIINNKEKFLNTVFYFNEINYEWKIKLNIIKVKPLLQDEKYIIKVKEK